MNRIKLMLERIRLIREAAKLKQEYMGARLGISQNAYSKMELGYTELTVPRLLQICELLQTTPEELLRETVKEEII